MKNMTLLSRFVPICTALVLLASCATTSQKTCPAGTQNLPDCPPLNAIDDPEINELYESRTWLPSKEIEEDLIELGKQADIPVQHARTKFLGPTDHAAID